MNKRTHKKHKGFTGWHIYLHNLILIPGKDYTFKDDRNCKFLTKIDHDDVLHAAKYENGILVSYSCIDTDPITSAQALMPVKDTRYIYFGSPDDYRELPDVYWDLVELSIPFDKES